MKFRDKKENKKEQNDNPNDIEIVIGDDSSLDISDVGDCMNDLRPRDNKKKRKTIVIPKIKK